MLLLTEPTESGLSTVEREREIDMGIRVEGDQMLNILATSKGVR